MKTLSTLSLDELKFIKEVLDKKELQEELNRLLETRQVQPFLVEQYQSSRLPEFYDEYKEQCSFLLSQLTYSDVKFLEVSCEKKGNNVGGRFYFYNQEAYERASTNVGYLENVFDGNDRNIYLYEGVYNTLNYIRTYICRSLHEGKRMESKHDLLQDYEEKLEVVSKSIKEIATELFELRLQIPNSRISVSNQALTRMTQKIGNSLTFRQEEFVDAVAFGSSLENLKNKDYKEAKRLLFVPQSRCR